jgi:hypothetical protein
MDFMLGEKAKGYRLTAAGLMYPGPAFAIV